MTEQPASRPRSTAGSLGSRNTEDTGPDAVYDEVAGWAADQGLELYPAQSEALIELVSGSNVVLATPTGSGKSLVAMGALYAAFARGDRGIWTAPVKALVSEKFFALIEAFGAANVGMLTGDASVNPDAPILTATAEVLANHALRDGPSSDLAVVVMDEFHYYGDPERGWAWQVPLLELPRAQFLLMSATLGDVSFFREDLTRRTGRSTAVVAGSDRPVPLTYYYERTPVHETIEELLATDRAPIYVVHPTQAAALERAQALTSVNIASREQRDAIAAAIGGFRFRSGFGATLSRLVRHGVGVHHAGMLPRYRRLVETLAQAGLAQGGLRHRHPRRGHQRADPHRAAHVAGQVRRHAGAPPHRARVPPDLRAGGAGRLRHRRHRGRAGARARGGERPADREGGRRPEEAQEAGAQEAARGVRVVGRGDVRPG